MLKKIEQHLLTNFPTIWNLKLIPIALLALLLHILFYGVGYLVTNTSIENGSYYDDGLFVLIFAGSILTIILVAIFWLIQYNKYNGLRAFYPISNISLYLEWLFTFALCALLCFVPISLRTGKEQKWRSAVSEREYNEVTKIISRVAPLLPSDEYYFQLSGDATPLMVKDANVDRTKFDTRLYNYEEDAEAPDNPIEYIGPSLLYYNQYYNYNADPDEISKVHQWLLDEKEDSIRATIQAFLDLHNKKKLKTNVDVDLWMKIIYNPPLYPVSDKALIKENTYYMQEGYPWYTQMSELNGFYSQAGEIYDKDDYEHNSRWDILIPLIIAMGLSVMIFSARITNGRSWIFALLSLGVLSFFFSLLMSLFALFNSDNLFLIIGPIYWLGLLVLMGIIILLKVSSNDKKGRSKIYINLFIWLIPTIIPWLFTFYLLTSKSWTTGLTQAEKLIFPMFVINIIFSTVIMFPIVVLLKKWKAIPED